MRIATLGDLPRPTAVTELHPVFGPGEDRNAASQWREQMWRNGLHPVFGPGEDRNGGPARLGQPTLWAAPGLRTG